MKITDFSPLSSAMYSMNDDILKSIKEYIDTHVIVKTNLYQQTSVDYPHIKRILEIPGFNMNSDFFLDQYLKHIYTMESLNVLINDINRIN